jgi:hypothetical protein
MVGRMISADPTVPDPLNAQSWNRYSYVGNDPLAFTDPSGFSWLSSFFHSVSHAVSSVAHFLTSNPIVKAVLQIALNIALNALIPGATFLVAAASAAIVTGLSGGNLGQILRAGVIAGATVLASGFLGGGIPAQAAIGCGASLASGGSCGSGAAAGAISAGLSPVTQALFPSAANDLGQRIGGTIIQATAGGLASVAGGGKFANGAATGAFGYLVALGPMRQQSSNPESGDPLDANAMDRPEDDGHEPRILQIGPTDPFARALLGAIVDARAFGGTPPEIRQLAQLLSANSPFNQDGTLTKAAIDESREIQSSLGNVNIPNGYVKYSTPSYASPAGDFQVHFYYNPSTNQPFYGLDYKVKFN